MRKKNVFAYQGHIRSFDQKLVFPHVIPSQYINIGTDAALDAIYDYLQAHEKEFSYHAEALIVAMDLVF